MNENSNGFWAVVEIFGHKRFAGFVAEQVFANETFVRIDVPATKDNAAFSKLFGAKAIYGITPCEEAVARAYAEALREKPLEAWLLSSQPALPAGGDDDDHEPLDEGPGYDDEELFDDVRSDADDELDRALGLGEHAETNVDADAIVAGLDDAIGAAENTVERLRSGMTGDELALSMRDNVRRLADAERGEESVE